jgi:hypothetical protein
VEKGWLIDFILEALTPQLCALSKSAVVARPSTPSLPDTWSFSGQEKNSHISPHWLCESLAKMELSGLLSKEPAQVSKRPQPKTIAFELLLDEGSKTRARIPLRILVNPHDSTESIITTVKNFYGIYDGHGVSFEDVHGNILIARYENLAHNSAVYVRTVAAPSQSIGPLGPAQYQGNTIHEPHRRSSLGEPFQMAPPHNHEQSRPPSRSASRLARKRSTSPPFGRGRRSASQQKPEPFSASRGSSANRSYNDDTANGYSDSDAGRSSITGSKRARSEQFASAEISVDNVLQDRRRMNSFFDSSVRWLCMIVWTSTDTPSGTPTFCSSASAYHHLYVLDISSTASSITRRSFTVPSACAQSSCVPGPTIRFPSKSRLPRKSFRFP